MVIIYFISVLALGFLSYGFVDPHLWTKFGYFAYNFRPEFSIAFFILLVLLFSLYVYFLKHNPKIWLIPVSAIILVFSYPALTYDLFNYIATAKVLYSHHENPYLVMPMEIPNEPNLAFTRAANKVALYGPVWIAITAIPHYLGGGNIWATLLLYKAMNTFVYLLFGSVIWRMTKNMKNVIFFMLNPLVLIEVIMNAHNDIFMMILALGALIVWQQKKYMYACALFVASWFIKEATIVLLPLFFIKNITLENAMVWSYVLLSGVFFVAAPLREELYPWYAVWLVATAALLPLKSHRFIFWFTIVLSFALELRNLPYMWMGYYEGPGPTLRLLFTIVPVGVFLLVYLLKGKRLPV